MLSQKVVMLQSQLCLINMLVTNVVAITLKTCICWVAPNTLVHHVAGITRADDTLKYSVGPEPRTGVYWATVTSMNPLYPFLPALTAAATRSKTVLFGRPMIASLVP